jgi:hypothetical protein
VRRAAPALMILTTLSACSPKGDETGPQFLTLDCHKRFDDQAGAIRAQAHLNPAPHAPGEPYDYYSSEDGRTSYLITEAGAPGHPAILMQVAGGGDVKTTGCAYGNKRGYEQLRTYLDSLKTWSRR